MRALQVSELHQLVPHESHVPICDDEMPFALLDREFRDQLASIRTARDDDAC